jgi:hypothetical protein
MNELAFLLSKGQSYKVLTTLYETLSGTDEGNTILLLMARWNSNQHEYDGGGLNLEYYRSEVARINRAIVSVMDRVNETRPTDRNFGVARKAQEVIQHIHHSYHNSVVQHHTGKGDNVARDKIITNQDPKKDAESSKKEPKKRILFLAAEPEKKIGFYAGKELQAIQDALNRSSMREVFEINSNFATNEEDLTRLLRKYKPEIVHFSMHGSPSGVYFEDAAGTAQSVEPDVLGDHFEQVNGQTRIINLVLLNACHAAAHAEYLAKYVGTAVGMNGAIPTDAALAYAKGFYAALFEGDSYKDAHFAGSLSVKQFARRIPEFVNKQLEDSPKIYS